MKIIFLYSLLLCLIFSFDIDNFKLQRNIKFNDLNLFGKFFLDIQGIVFEFDQLSKIHDIIREYGYRLDDIENSFIIDYRLVQECRFVINDGFLVFSVNKLEKNEVMNIKIDYKDDITKRMKDECLERKDKIIGMKNQLLLELKSRINVTEDINKLTKNMKKKNSEKENVEKFLSETNEYMYNRHRLSELNSNQLKHLKLLKDNSKNLIEKEKIQLKSISNKSKQLSEKINDIELSIQNNSIKQKLIERDIANLTEYNTQMENELIETQKNYLEIENIFNKIKSERMKLEKDIFESKLMINTTFIDKNNFNKEILSNMNKYEILEKKLNNTKETKSIVENNISITKDEVKNIDKEIKKLYEERNNKIENLRNHYNILNKHENKIITIETELESLLYKNNQLDRHVKEKIFKLEEEEKNFEFLINQKNNLTNSYKIYNDNTIFFKNKLISKSEELNIVKKNITEKKIDYFNINQDTHKLLNEKNESEFKENAIKLEIKSLQSMINNHQIQIENFEREIKKIENNLSLRLNDGKDEFIEYKSEDNIISNDINKIESEIEKLRKEKENINLKIKNIEKKFKTEVPTVKLTIDMIMEEINYSYNKDSLKKIENLIFSIKN